MMNERKDCMVPKNTNRLSEHHNFLRIIRSILPIFLVKSLTNKKRSYRMGEGKQPNANTYTTPR